MNNPGRYARFQPSPEDAARLSQLEKNLNLAINKEKGLSANLRNAEKNLKQIEKNHVFQLIMLKRQYPHIWTLTPHMAYKRAGVDSTEYNKREKNIKNKLNRAKARVDFLKRKIGENESRALAVITKHLKTPGGLLNRIRFNAPTGTEYLKHAQNVPWATKKTNENWAKLVREARRQGRREGVSIGQRRAAL